MEFEVVDKGAPRVLFIGGPLDGIDLPLPELGEAYSVRDFHPPLRHRASVPPDEPGEPDYSEYVRVERDDAFYYVERELWELSSVQGMDPAP